MAGFVMFTLVGCAASGPGQPFLLDLRDGQEIENFRGTEIPDRGFIFDTNRLQIQIRFSDDEEITLAGLNKGAVFRGETFENIYVRQTGYTSETIVDETMSRAATAEIDLDRTELQSWVDTMGAIGEGTTQFPQRRQFGTRELSGPGWTAYLSLLVQSPDDYTIEFSLQ